jgi:hypothetical protein
MVLDLYGKNENANKDSPSIYCGDCWSYYVPCDIWILVSAYVNDNSL